MTQVKKNNSPMNNILEVIKFVMKSRKLSEQKVAKMCGLSQSKIHRTISNSQKFWDQAAVNKICAVLGVDEHLAPPRLGEDQVNLEMEMLRLAIADLEPSTQSAVVRELQQYCRKLISETCKA